MHLRFIGICCKRSSSESVSGRNRSEYDSSYYNGTNLQIR